MYLSDILISIFWNVIIWNIYFIKILHRLQIKVCLTCKCCKTSINVSRIGTTYNVRVSCWRCVATDIYLQKASFSLYLAKQLIALQRRERRDDQWLHSLRYKPVYHDIHNIHFFCKGFRHFIYFSNELDRLDSRESRVIKVHGFFIPISFIWFVDVPTSDSPQFSEEEYSIFITQEERKIRYLLNFFIL